MYTLRRAYHAVRRVAFSCSILAFSFIAHNVSRYHISQRRRAIHDAVHQSYFDALTILINLPSAIVYSLLLPFNVSATLNVPGVPYLAF